MQASKILLSAEELNLAENSEWILTKNRIIQKIISLFAQLAGSFQENTFAYKQFLPPELFDLSPKISRGEQHRGLPYVMLDYPRIFSKENVFAIRSFFWWGNFFSLTLHLKGNYKDQFERNIKEHGSLLAQKNFFISIGEDEWRQDFEEDNYLPLNSTNGVLLNKYFSGKDFLKLAVKWPLRSSNEMEPILEDHHAFLLQVVARHQLLPKR